jgi:O-antigen/teichoic acid export membrane protein
MSASKKIVFGAIAGWGSRVTTIILGLLLMPALFRNLPYEELGLWLLIGQSASLFGVLDLGLNLTVTRRIAFAQGKLSSVDSDDTKKQMSQSELADLVESSKFIYRCMAIGVFLLTSCIGALYLSSIGLDGGLFSKALTGWIVLCASNSIAILAWRWTCILQGCGFVGWESIVASVGSAFTIIIQIVAVLFGGGLISLALISAIGALMQRSMILGLARKKRPDIFQIQGNWNHELIMSLVSPSLKAWITGLGWAIAVHTDQFFVVHAGGASSLPAYRAAYLILFNFALISITVSGASSVFVSQAWEAGRIEEVRQLLVRNANVALLTIGCGGAFAIGLGSKLFDAWLGEGNFIGYPTLIFFFITMVLEVQANALSTSSRATEDEAFVYSSILAALLKVGLAVVLVRLYGLIGVAAATMISLAATNHWYMVYRGANRCKISFGSYAKQVVVPSATVFLSYLLIAFAVARLTTSFGDIVSVGTTCVCLGVTWAIAIWFIALNASERIAVRSYAQKFRAA